MVLTHEEQALALLHLGAKTIRRATALLRAHDHARRVAGNMVADWAFADNALDSEPFQRLREWVDKSHVPHLVTISGPNGRGKTVAAVKWAGRTGGMFLRADDFGREDWAGGKLARLALNARHLVIDDLGAERGRARDHVTALIARRYDAGYDTLATTTAPYGKKSDDAGTIMGEYPGSVHSRMSAGFILVGGKDLRSGAAPVLGEIERARSVVAAADGCRRQATMSTSARIQALISLAEVIGVRLDDDRLHRVMGEMRSKQAQATRELEAFAAEMQRRAVAVADKRRGP